jgi:hypothetical protein|tara:strand:- start:1396 stop:2442 length:1047 start_codon:yes stop_codon:yes gene_type:complete
MAKSQRNFIAGRMNKSLDERLIPNGEYEDALNVRLGSTEASEIGSVENTKGNSQLSALFFLDKQALSPKARCIGAFQDSANETIYWFVHDPNFTLADTGKCDMIVSFDTKTAQVTYHVVSTDDGSGINTTLNFNPQNLITGINIIGELLFFTDNLNAPRFINVNRSYKEPLLDGNPPGPIAALWKFKAESLLVAGTEFIGFHRGTLLGCPNPLSGFGQGVSPSLNQIPLPGVDCYTDNLGLPITKGYGIQGSNFAQGLALTQFSTNTNSGTSTINLINADTISNPGASAIAGSIKGDDGSTGTFTANYTPSIFSYTDGNGDTQNPESGGTVIINGLTLTDQVTYTLTS